MWEIAEIIFSILLIALILLQERSGGASGLLGGGGDASYQTRRGAEKIIFWATIVCAVIFVGLAILKIIGW